MRFPLFFLKQFLLAVEEVFSTQVLNQEFGIVDEPHVHAAAKVLECAIDSIMPGQKRLF